ncbi:MAG: hypothetical protein DRO09_04260, partial [Thermoprotei archaeon]
MRRAQIVVITSLILAVLLLSTIMSMYEAKLVYLRTRSIVVREVVGAITADFERALAHVLAVATRAYFNYTRFESMLAKYRPHGINLYNRHNFTVARDFGFKFLELWRTFVMEAYAGYGVQVDFEPAERDIAKCLGRRRVLPEGALMKGWWYYPISGSAASAKLKLNLTGAGFYGWESEVTVGLFVRLHENYTVSEDENWTEIAIGVKYDKGEPWPYLLTKGWVEIYYPRQDRWARADIIDVTYLGNGNYSVRFSPAVEPCYDPVTGREFVPLLVVVQDDRGVLVETCSYTHIVFKVKRRIPDTVPYGGESEVACWALFDYWSLRGSEGRTWLKDNIRFKPLARDEESRTIIIRHPDGTLEEVILPRRVVDIYFDHDSKLHGNGTIAFREDYLYIRGLYVSRIRWGGKDRYTDVWIERAELRDLAWELSSLDLEFRGELLEVDEPCPVSGRANWRVYLEDLWPIDNVTAYFYGSKLIVQARADYGIVEKLSGGIQRPYDTRHEVYTLEFTWDLDLYWLGMKLPEEEGLRLPPVPWIPIKQLRVNVSSDGTENTLGERPIQYEEWRNVTWHGIEVPVPLGLSDPQMDFSPTTRLVFQVRFPNLDIDEQFVAIWWVDDLDAEPAAYPSSIRYIEDSTHKDVWHPVYDVEFVDVEHPTSRGYVDYEGVAAFVLRDPETDFAFGPYNLHMFGRYGNSLGRYRPYGVWEVYYRYMRYSWIQAPIRIFAVLNTTLVGNVYTEGDVREDYYDTVAIVHVVNGTRYIPVITYVYWKYARRGRGYWLCTEMGRGIADWFAYVNLD